MKIMESSVLGLILIALVVRFLDLPGSKDFTTVAFGLAAVFYLLFGFALFNRVPLRGLFQARSYQNTTPLTLAGAALLGVSFALILTGALFKLQFRSAADPLLLAGILSGALIFGISGFIRNNYAGWFHKNIRQRVIGMVGMGAILYFLM